MKHQPKVNTKGRHVHCVLPIIKILVIITTYHNKVEYDRPGECSPEKDCLR